MDIQGKQNPHLAGWLLFGIGGLLLALGIFADPYGASPDTGVLDLGPNGTRWFLRILGLAFWGAGAWGYFKNHKSCGP